MKKKYIYINISKLSLRNPDIKTASKKLEINCIKYAQ